MIIKYDPRKVDNIAKFVNKAIEKYNDEKYLMFIFEDIYQNVIDIDIFYNKYVSLIKRFDLPFAFYPYYIHFNKVLQKSLSLASPKIKIKINGEFACDVVSQTSYGMFLIDTDKLKSINFKFNELFKSSFYIQQLVEESFNNKLIHSTNSFLDVTNSFNLVKSSFKDGYFIDIKSFTEEKTKFYSMYKMDSDQTTVQDFIEATKKQCQEIKAREAAENVKLVEVLEDIKVIDYKDLEEK